MAKVEKKMEAAETTKPIEREVTITLTLKEAAEALGYLSGRDAWKIENDYLDADPYEDVWHTGYSANDVLKFHDPKGMDGATQLFPDQIAVAAETADRYELAAEITKERHRVIEQAFDKIEPVGEYLSADNEMISVGGTGISCSVDASKDEVALKIKNPEHLINDIVAGVGRFAPELDPHVAASDEEIKAGIIAHAGDYFEVYGDRKPAVSDRIDAGMDEDVYAEEAKHQIGEMTPAEIAEAVLDAVDEGRFESENEAIALAAKLTSEPKAEIAKAVKATLSANKEKLSSRESGVAEESVQMEAEEVMLHSTLKPDHYYVEFSKLPKEAQEKLKAAEVEIENSRYTVGEDMAYIRAEVEVNGKLWDAEISLGSVDIRHAGYEWDDEEGAYVDEDGRPIDSDEHAEYVASELAGMSELDHMDVYLDLIEELQESGEAKSWRIFDWAGNLMFDGEKFESFEDAEEFLSVKLGDSYETDRQEYEIRQAEVRNARYLDPKMGGKKAAMESKALKEKDIKHENGNFWVADEGDAYTVYRTGSTHSTSDSSYTHDEDGLSLAKARCDYLAKRFPKEGAGNSAGKKAAMESNHESNSQTRNTTKYLDNNKIIRSLQDAAYVYGLDLDGCVTLTDYRTAFSSLMDSPFPGAGSFDPTIGDWLDELEDRGIDLMDITEAKVAVESTDLSITVNGKSYGYVLNESEQDKDVMASLVQVVKKHFPDSYVHASKGSLGGDFLSFGIVKDKADLPSGIRDNDPSLSLWSIEKGSDGSVSAKLVRGGTYSIKSSNPARAMDSVKLGWRNKTSTLDGLVGHFDRYLSKAKEIMKDNVDQSYGDPEQVAIYKKALGECKELVQEEKNLTEAWLPRTLKPEHQDLVSEVSNKLKYEINAAMAFAVALLEDVNAHEEAAKVNAALTEVEEQIKLGEAKKLDASSASKSNARVKFWVSADGQSSLNMSGATASEALKELLDQCADEEQRAAILAGYFLLEEQIKLGGSALDESEDEEMKQLDKMQAELQALYRSDKPEDAAKAKELQPKVDALFKKLYSVKNLGESKDAVYVLVKDKDGKIIQRMDSVSFLKALEMPKSAFLADAVKKYNETHAEKAEIAVRGLKEGLSSGDESELKESSAECPHCKELVHVKDDETTISDPYVGMCPHCGKSSEEKPKPLKEAAGDGPAVYVGTYGKYNSGSIAGKWLNLEDYASHDDFMEAAKELHKDEEDPELMFQDYQGFPDRYYSESEINPNLWDWLELNKEDRDLLEVYIDEVNDEDATIDQAQSAFRGKYDSERDWAIEDIDLNGGLSESQAANFLYVDDVTARQIGLEEADIRIGDMDEEEIVSEAGMDDEYNAAVRAKEIKDELDYLDDEEDAAEIADLEAELAQIPQGARDTDVILSKARDEVEFRISDEIEEKIKKDAVGYFVDELGAYTVEELAKQSFVSIDYDAYARDAQLSGDISFVRKDGDVWVFASH